MTTDEKIREALRGINKNHSDGSTIIGVVTAVDEEAATITVNIGSESEPLELEDVRLRATEGSAEGMYLVPADKSNVLLIRIGESDEFYMLGATKYKKLVVKGETISFEVNQDGIIFNAAALGSFMTDINKLVTKINTLEKSVNDLKTIFTNWVPAPQDGGAQLKKGAAQWAGQQITETKVDDIKDGTIQN